MAVILFFPIALKHKGKRVIVISVVVVNLVRRNWPEKSKVDTSMMWSLLIYQIAFILAYKYAWMFVYKQTSFYG